MFKLSNQLILVLASSYTISYKYIQIENFKNNNVRHILAFIFYVREARRLGQDYKSGTVNQQILAARSVKFLFLKIN